MGEYADMHLDGTLCECCGVTMRGPGNGEPRRCRDCGPIDAPFVHPSTKVACPTCKKRVKLAGISDHMRDAHPPARPEPAAPVMPQWPIKGVRVDGDTVVVSVKGGNDAARWLCGELVALISAPSEKELT